MESEWKEKKRTLLASLMDEWRHLLTDKVNHFFDSLFEVLEFEVFQE